MPSHAFAAIVNLSVALGHKDVSKRPGCVEIQVDDQWWLALNPHHEPISSSHGGPPVHPFTVVVEYNGWPAGILDVRGGIIAAGEAANEQAFIAALDRAAVAAGGNLDYAKEQNHA